MDGTSLLRNNVAHIGGIWAFRFMDKLDRRILDLLQRNGELTAAEVAERVGLSKVPCWRRIRRLQRLARLHPPNG